ncbi:M28 family metallopeptidase [Hugenholtzia roseola]|uniref:M28 family metallopeptidase n=1 Tax=Hugenholtzia roseola TaxID=1002 RepID=UPI0004112DF6|nr:M28 family peptidase [Hugenholtzia roseola]
MKKQKKIQLLIFFAALCLLYAPLWGQKPDSLRVRKHIARLCAPDMHGRGYEQKGDKVAADYISAEFEKIGLEKFGTTYFQNFTISVNTFSKKKIQLQKEKLIVGKDYLVNPISISGKGKGEIYYLDSAQMTFLLKDKTAQTQFLNQNLSKKIVAYPANFYGKVVEHAPEILRHFYTSKAVLSIENKLTATLSPEGFAPATFQVSKKIFDSLYQIEKEKGKKVTAKFQLQHQTLPQYPTQNVLGYVKGKKNPQQWLVFSAHYDHLGRVSPEHYFAGANDNASGVAMLLELAAYFKANPADYSVAFIAFGAEEIGLKGSLYYVQNPYFPLKQIKFLMNLDLLGTGDTGATVVNATIFEKEFALLQEINREKQFLPQILSRGEAPNSDHYFFFRAGVPCFFIYLTGGIQAYHDIYDRPETLPLTRFEETFALLIQFMSKF